MAFGLESLATWSTAHAQTANIGLHLDSRWKMQNLWPHHRPSAFSQDLQGIHISIWDTAV